MGSVRVLHLLQGTLVVSSLGDLLKLRPRGIGESDSLHLSRQQALDLSDELRTWAQSPRADTEKSCDQYDLDTESFSKFGKPQPTIFLTGSNTLSIEMSPYGDSVDVLTTVLQVIGLSLGDFAAVVVNGTRRLGRFVSAQEIGDYRHGDLSQAIKLRLALPAASSRAA